MILEDPYLREAEREISALLGEDDPHPKKPWCPAGFTLLPNGLEFRCPHGKRVPDVFVAAHSTCQCDKDLHRLLEVEDA